MTRTSVGILRGGTSSEYNLSLKSGSAVMAALPEDRFDTRDIFIDKRGYWHMRGQPVDAAAGDGIHRDPSGFDRARRAW